MKKMLAGLVVFFVMSASNSFASTNMVYVEELLVARVVAILVDLEVLGYGNAQCPTNGEAVRDVLDMYVYSIAALKVREVSSPISLDALTQTYIQILEKIDSLPEESKKKPGIVIFKQLLRQRSLVSEDLSSML